MNEFRIKVLIFMIPLILPMGRLDLSTAKPTQGEADLSADQAKSPVGRSKATGSKALKSNDAQSGQPSPAVMHRLGKIESAAKKLHTLKARLRYDRIQGLLNDRQRRFGSLVYQAGPPPKFEARFNRLIVDNTARKIDRRFIFDGKWLARINGKDKTFERRQLVKAKPKPSDAKSSDRDQSAKAKQGGHPQNQNHRPTRRSGQLGLSGGSSGPFVLPFDAEKRDIVRRFEVSQLPVGEDGPKHTFHLRLKPRDKGQTNYTRIDLWYDTQSYLPRRVATRDESRNRSIIELLKTQVNPKLAKRSFDTTPPRGGGWDVQVLGLDRSAGHQPP